MWQSGHKRPSGHPRRSGRRKPYGFSSIKLRAVTAGVAQFGPPGYETSLLYLAYFGALVVGGPGPLAVDGLLAGRKTAGER